MNFEALERTVRPEFQILEAYSSNRVVHLSFVLTIMNKTSLFNQSSVSRNK